MIENIPQPWLKPSNASPVEYCMFNDANTLRVLGKMRLNIPFLAIDRPIILWEQDTDHKHQNRAEKMVFSTS